mmetsp:Transcript_15579/g.23208  ORF Transcript_15579/g.23208 Transcript_15579/m.23208 type:complete len:238 (+) Transcript_15579:82-795(+)
MDSWDDDDFQVPIIDVKSKAKTSWEDEEEEEEEIKSSGKAKLTEKQKEMAKKAKDEKINKIARKYEESMFQNETPEEKRERERKQVEEAEKLLAEELFISRDLTGSSKDEEGREIQLKTTEDHVKIALELGEKMKKASKQSDILIFLKEVVSITQSKLSSNELKQLSNQINAFEKSKKMEEERSKKLAAKLKMENDKKEAQKAKKKIAADVFGGDYDNVGDEYDEMGVEYSDKYDFM